MLNRIYATAFNKQADSDAHITKLEAKLRDHNKLGRELELFTTVESIGQGLLFYYQRSKSYPITTTFC